ncbi:dipeptide ABC transporter ATP-binding protein [Allostreptomyces psammosilenae]|uniref:Peptide/nickel transport system ATP-binding protein n=1 Tax=Allostreptomyces psammosilenae TaxID=1892865 RepID=A0A852ZPG1_9ACTN|nr:ABC transporter ATP-binding protein [Allostreptomyces psammosilenae]NYI04336.1 peptide/nickel transport system ATP-binding protein [Allostreptomyces psammosilenae]
MTDPRHDEGPLLSVHGLRVAYRVGTGREVEAVRGVDLRVDPGEVVALVGESGSGKTTVAQSVIGLLPTGGAVRAGRVLFEGEDLVALPERRMTRVRGARIGLVPQDPGVSLDPVRRVGDQVAEALRLHRAVDRRTARATAVDLLREAGLPEPEVAARRHPHELSGGQRQRVLIAAALACRPRLVIADEPTSALDVTVQRVVLDALDTLTGRHGTAVLLITHDLGVAADRAQRVVVMRHGRVVEEGPTAQVLRAPRDPYTRELLAAAPSLASARLITLRDRPPRRAGSDDPLARPASAADAAPPADRPPTPLVEVVDLRKEYRTRLADGRRHTLAAVDGVSFSVPRGRTLALVGESGSGKTTTARMVLGLTGVTAGTVRFDGEDVTGLRGRPWRLLRRRMQPVHQNPYASLDPRFGVADIVEEPLRAFGIGDRDERRRRVAEAVEQVALPSSVANRRPRELSGGQRQRVAIARALVLRPDLLVLDEPVSALDVSVQARILELLVRLQGELGLTYLLISHDLAVVRQVADDVAVMRRGRLVEAGACARVLAAPAHDYTRELLDAVPGRRAVRSA